MNQNHTSYEHPVISGVITGESGKALYGAEVCLEKEDKIVARAFTDESGRYEISVHTGPGDYDLSATWEKLGKWQFGIEVKDGDHISVDLALKLALSIKQRVLTRNLSIPHTYLHIKALRLDSDNSTILSISSTKTSAWGEYAFVNLKPGNYEIRCYTTDGYVYQYKRGELWYYQYGKLPREKAYIFKVVEDKCREEIYFSFGAFKTGTWRNYTSINGLINTSVRSIVQDPDGMMWFATYGGVSRYDGRDFVSLTAKDGLADDFVNHMYQDPDGIFWFATNGGVSIYDGKGFNNLTIEDGLIDNVVNFVYRDPDGTIWFATDEGVSRYDGKAFVNYTVDDGLPGKCNVAIVRDSKGNLWFGTHDDGIARYDGKTFVKLTEEDGLVSNELTFSTSFENGMSSGLRERVT